MGTWELWYSDGERQREKQLDQHDWEAASESHNIHTRRHECLHKVKIKHSELDQNWD